MAYLLCSVLFVVSFGVLMQDAWHQSSRIWFDLVALVAALVALIVLAWNDRRAMEDSFLRTLKADRQMRDMGCLKSLRSLIAYLLPNTTIMIPQVHESDTCRMYVYLAAVNPEEADPVFSVTVTNSQGFRFFHKNESGEDIESGVEFVTGLLAKRHHSKPKA